MSHSVQIVRKAVPKLINDYICTDFRTMETIEIYKPKHKIRFVTAAALFDGHDATINIMR